MTSISLSELTTRIQEVIRLNFNNLVWVRAEIGEMHVNSSGHCYMELTEKAENSDNLVAKVRANCWANVFQMLKPYFENETGQMLRAGLQVLVAVSVDFHSVYGFSLNIKDIDPVFTVGDMAVRRQQILRRLESEGIIDMNKSLLMPAVPQRLAIISSPTAAGYGDFMQHLQESNFAFYPVLFPAVMQGEGAVPSIVAALEKIYDSHALFDAVIIIRGGGATTDLQCFDTYELSLNAAQFPLPILAGIGHQRDNSVLDVVANRSLKTPTAVADFLIDIMQDAKNEMLELVENFAQTAKNAVEIEKNRLQNLRWRISSSITNLTNAEKYEVQRIRQKLFSAVHRNIDFQRNKLLLTEKMLATISPASVLQRGYSITTLGGKKICSIKEVNISDKIITFFCNGTMESEVLKLKID